MHCLSFKLVPVWSKNPPLPASLQPSEPWFKRVANWTKLAVMAEFWSKLSHTTVHLKSSQYHYLSSKILYFFLGRSVTKILPRIHQNMGFKVKDSIFFPSPLLRPIRGGKGYPATVHRLPHKQAFWIRSCDPRIPARSTSQLDRDGNKSGDGLEWAWTTLPRHCLIKTWIS